MKSSGVAPCQCSSPSGARAGIFAALLDDDERAFQQQVLAGPPPLGPGVAPLDRLIAYGAARTVFLIEHCDIARAALDGHQPIPADHKARCPRCISGCCSGR